MDRIIEIKVNGNYLAKDNKNAGVQGEANSTRLRIEFDEGWDGYAKTVTFWNALHENSVKRTLTADLLEDLAQDIRTYLVPIPGEAMTEAGEMTFVIDGYDGELFVGDRHYLVASAKAEGADDSTLCLADELTASDLVALYGCKILVGREAYTVVATGYRDSESKQAALTLDRAFTHPEEGTKLFPPGGRRQRSVSDHLRVRPAPMDLGADEPADPTPSQAEQLQVQIDTVLGDMQALAVRAENGAEAAGGHAAAAKEEADRASEAAESAERSKLDVQISEKQVENSAAGALKSADEALAAKNAAVTAQQAVENMRVSVKTLEPGSLASVEKSMVEGSVSLRIGIPRGDVGPTGPQGERGPRGETGQAGPAGAAGKDGVDGLTPSIGPDGCWLIGAQYTGVPATGKDGRDGSTPWIGANGNWLIDGVDTGFPSRGPAGQNGKDGAAGAAGKNGQDGHTPVKGTDYWTAEDQDEIAQAAYEELVKRTEWQATKTVLSGGDEIIPQSNLNFTTSFIAVRNFTGSFMVGLKYIVEWDGAEYTCMGHSGDGGVYIGNGSLVGESESNNEPFCVQWYAGTNYVNVHKKTSTKETITFRLTTDAVFKYNALPSEYLPMAEIVDAVKGEVEPGGGSDGCVKTVNGKAPDENGNVQIETGSGGGVSSWNNLTDRPFGTETIAGEVLPETVVALSVGDGTIDKVIKLTVGKKYIVNFNGAGYECTAQDASGTAEGAVLLGNGLHYDLVGYGEPFTLIAMPNTGITVDTNEYQATEATFSIRYEWTTKTTLPVEDMHPSVPYVVEGENVEILPETTFALESGEGAISTDAIPLTTGETYTVNWNGTDYECVAQDLSAMMAGAVLLGDGSSSGGTSNGEPFGVAVVPGMGTIALAHDLELTEATVSIKGKITKINKLDNRCLDLMWIPGVTEEFNKVLLDQTLWFAGTSAGEDKIFLEFVAGKKYKVVWDGTEYVCVANAYNFAGIVVSYIGNTMLVNIGDIPRVDTGEPFFIQAMGASFGAVFNKNTNDAVNVAIKIIEGEFVPNKIPPEFLPDGVPYVAEGGSKVEILPETVLDLNSEIQPYKLGLVAGETYSVKWDGAEYECVAQEVNEDGVTTVCLGDLYTASDGSIGTAATGEPFVLMEYPPALAEEEMGIPGAFMFLPLTDDPTDLTLAIYQGSNAKEVINKLDRRCLPDGTPYITTEVLLEESEAEAYDTPAFGKMWLIEAVPQLSLGDSYVVTYNGSAYSCVCQPAPAGFTDDADAVCMGNFTVVGGENTGEPFAMLFSVANQRIDIIDLAGSTAVRVGISKDTVNKLDRRCLPECIETVELPEYEVVLPETTLDTGGTMYQGSGYDFELAAGDDYIVTWNGTRYKVKCTEVADNGNKQLNVIEKNTDDPGEHLVFSITRHPNSTILAVDPCGATTVVLSIDHVVASSGKYGVDASSVILTSPDGEKFRLSDLAKFLPFEFASGVNF